MTFASFVELYTKDMKNRVKANTWHSKEHTMDFINTLRFWGSMYQEWLEDPESFAERYLSSNNAAGNTRTAFQEPRDDNLPF